MSPSNALNVQLPNHTNGSTLEEFRDLGFVFGTPVPENEVRHYNRQGWVWASLPPKWEISWDPSGDRHRIILDLNNNVRARFSKGPGLSELHIHTLPSMTLIVPPIPRADYTEVAARSDLKTR